MIDALNAIREEALRRIGELPPDASEADIRDLKAAYLGKDGSLTAALRGMGKLFASERPKVDRIANDELRQESRSQQNRVLTCWHCGVRLT